MIVSCFHRLSRQYGRVVKPSPRRISGYVGTRLQPAELGKQVQPAVVAEVEMLGQSVQLHRVRKIVGIGAARVVRIAVPTPPAHLHRGPQFFDVDVAANDLGRDEGFKIAPPSIGSCHTGDRTP